MFAIWQISSSFAWGAWTIQTVDSGGTVGWYTSIALASSDYPHISYYGNYGLKYARWDGSSWDIQWVDNGGYFTSIALDSSNYPHISHWDGTNSDLKYARWNGTSWDIQTVEDREGYVGLATSIALDSSDYPHISYYDDTNDDLKYARWDGSSWIIQTVDSEGDVVGATSIALDSSDYPHISYWDGGTNADLKYARWNGSSWDIQTVDSEGGVGYENSIALDSSDYPHISYYDGTNDDLKYARWDGTGWVIQTVDSEGDVGSATSIALDSSDYPRISYYDGTNDDLKYARWDGTGWVIQTVDSEGDVGSATSIALDSSDYPHISYCDWTNLDLKYAQWTPLTGSITINNGTQFTNSRDVTLTLSATNASQMCFSNDKSSWTNWENYATSKSWTLTSGDGTKTVYVKFKDSAGDVSEIYSDDIILDTTPPKVAITFPSADTSVRGEVVIKGTASDENFREYKVEYGQGTEPTSWTEITTSNSQVIDGTLATWDTTVLNDGSYTLRLTAADLAGNWTEIQVSLRVDKHPPQAALIDYPTDTVTGNTPKVAVTFTWTGSDPDGITPVEKLVYQCKLEDHLDYQDWSDWSQETTKIYMLPSGDYAFKVRAKDEAGNYPEEDDPATAKCSFTVSLPIIIYPNPSYPNQGQIVTIANLPLTSDLKIYIYDLGGNLIRTLGESEANIEGGSKTATWDCRNDNGELVTRGIYIYITKDSTGKIAVVK